MKKTRQSATIYRGAMAFYNLALPAYQDDSILEKCGIAAVANMAFCVELLLKCSDVKVTLVDGILGHATIKSNVRGHDLIKIFRGIDPIISNNLAKLFKKKTDKELLPLLEKYKDYFMEARYFWEPDYRHSFDISGIKSVADGLNDALIEGYGKKTDQ